MAHEFVVLHDGVQKTYSNYEDIPDDFENIVKFLPDIPDGPHTKEQHEEIEQWHLRFQLLIEKEKRNAGRNEDR